jgi:hypothetical protein
MRGNALWLATYRILQIEKLARKRIREKHDMAKAIVAVAIAETPRTITIKQENDMKQVRPYIPGLYQGLKSRGLTLGPDYQIIYRECPIDQLSAADTFSVDNPAYPVDNPTDPIIFCMSTTVVRAALEFTRTMTPPIPIVGVVSNPGREGFAKVEHICGISARRSQTAGECFSRFLDTVPSLKTVYVLHKPNYPPSDEAIRLIDKAKPPGITVPKLNFQNYAELIGALKSLPTGNPAEQGILVLPVDIAFGSSVEIIDWARTKKLPCFFPITDWVSKTLPSALGGYGVSQTECGRLMAERVEYIWSHKNTTPPKRWSSAPSIEWLASAAAAADLKIELSEFAPLAT